VAPILLIFLRIKLTRVYACHFLLCIFLTGGVYPPYSPCMSTPLALTSPSYGTIRYDIWFALGNWQESCQFNLAQKLKKTMF